MEIEYKVQNSAKCGNCGHELKEHYHLKDDGYGCIGIDETCACISFDFDKSFEIELSH